MKNIYLITIILSIMGLCGHYACANELTNNSPEQEKLEISPNWDFMKYDSLASHRYQDSKRSAKDFFKNSSNSYHRTSRGNDDTLRNYRSDHQRQNRHLYDSNRHLKNKYSTYDNWNNGRK